MIDRQKDRRLLEAYESLGITESDDSITIIGVQSQYNGETPLFN